MASARLLMPLTTDAPSWLAHGVLMSALSLALMSCGPAQSEWDGSFRGLGQEPGWMVEIDSDRLRWVGDYGEVEFVTGPPAMEELAEGDVVWTARTEEHEILVSATDDICHDVMSGQEFTHTVTVEVDGDTYTGCGRWQDSPGDG